MKTIEISDEMYDKLISLATEITTQNPRGTRYPHIFQIRNWKKQYDWGLNGDIQIWITEYGDEIETIEEFKEFLEDNNHKIPDNLEDVWNDYWVMEEFIEDNNIELKYCTYTLEPIFENCFLSEKAAQEHLKSNYYHYHKNADVYLTHGWRNPEMEMITQFLCELVGKKPYT